MPNKASTSVGTGDFGSAVTSSQSGPTKKASGYNKPYPSQVGPDRNKGRLNRDGREVHYAGKSAAISKGGKSLTGATDS